MPIILRPEQVKLKTDIYDAWNSGQKNVLAVLPTGMGKCLGRDTSILMHDGSVKLVQYIVVGDKLMGPDSAARVVLSVCQGRSGLFKIQPIKGESWICNDIHVLTLKHTETNDVIDIPLDHYLKKNKTFRHVFKQFRVGVDFPKSPIWTDPYLLGLYLAEGTYSAAQITNPEPEILEYLSIWAEKNEMKIKTTHKKNHFEMSFSDHKSGWNKNKIRRLAQSCTNRDDRWVPYEFLINDRATRLQILAGLLDGDGHLTNGSFEIITKYDSLNRDILFLARSLGFSAYSKRKISTIKSINFSGVYHRILIGGHIDSIPNKVERKKASARKQIKDVLKTGFKVDSLGQGDYYGFELDGDGRFLLGDFTVTHNTKTFATIAMDMALGHNKFPTAIQVHRKELVQQISLTLAEEEIPHNIIAPRSVILGIVAAQRRLLRRQFYDYNAQITVVSVDTLIARIHKHEKWAKSIRLWITDEASHLLKNNKWGKAVSFFPEALGLGVTATPERLDKRGLGRHADGVFDIMVEGPDTRWGINNQRLCKYKIAIPQGDYQNFLKKASDGSDYSKEAMILASQRSHIIGDVVKNYRKFADGKQAIVFSTDINTGTELEKKFISAGVKAKFLSSLSGDKERLDALIDYRDKKIQVMVNVDLFDEGLDVPGIECVIHARPTMSKSKYRQMNGRGLRPAKDKPHLIIIDHVGNVAEHGLPCDAQKWTLDRIVKRRDKTNFIRICSNVECNAPYDRTLSECPWCGTEALKGINGGGSGRVPPRQVDGDLYLIDPETIREMEAKTKLDDPEVVGERVSFAAGTPAGIRAMRNQARRIETQKDLANMVAKWAGYFRHHGYSDRQIHKKFYLQYDATISEKLAEPRAEMLEMIEKLEGDLPREISTKTRKTKAEIETAPDT